MGSEETGSALKTRRPRCYHGLGHRGTEGRRLTQLRHAQRGLATDEQPPRASQLRGLGRTGRRRSGERKQQS